MVLREFMSHPLGRKHLEIARARVKIFSVTEVNANLRKHHVGQIQLRGMRPFTSKQIAGNVPLLSGLRDAVAYISMRHWGEAIA